MDYQLVIIGAGPAGYTAALLAASKKIKTALIDRNLSRIGGTCLNEGCIPFKGLLHESVRGRSMAEVISHVMEKTGGIRNGLIARLKAAGVDLIEAEAVFTSKTSISAGGRIITANDFLIAAGSKPMRLFDSPAVKPSDFIFTLSEKPESALIIGGGVIGCEYASYLNNMGVKVTIAEARDSILSGEDSESVRMLSREFKKKGVRVLAPCRITGITGDAAVSFETVDEKFGLIIEATGRTADTAGLGLEYAGVETDGKGFIRVNEKGETNIKNIYAAGDCIATPMLAYTAYKEAENVIASITHGKAHAIDYAKMPRLVFSSPQLGGCGATEDALKAAGAEYTVYKYFFKAIGKAVVEGEDTGFVKLLSEGGIITGASVVGAHAAEIVNELSVIINAGLSVEKVKDIMHIHPSYGEIIAEALLFGKSN